MTYNIELEAITYIAEVAELENYDWEVAMWYSDIDYGYDDVMEYMIDNFDVYYDWNW